MKLQGNPFVGWNSAQEQWRHVAPRAAANEGSRTVDRKTPSSTLSSYAGGDLKNTTKTTTTS
jgi:hypothetical protein